MRNVAAGMAVTVSVPLEDPEGNAVEATSIMVTVVDEDGRVLAGPEMLADTTVSAVEYVVAGPINTLSPGVRRGIRTVEVDVLTRNGRLGLRSSYMVRAALQLQRLVNTFQSAEAAELIAADMVKLDAYNAASDEVKQGALIEAFTRITRLGFYVREAGDEQDQDRILGLAFRVIPREWPVMDDDRWLEFPERFKTALKRAQVAEANAILSPGGAEDYRRMGLLSKTTGESSAMFRSGKPLDLGISRATLDELAGYVELRLTATRS